MKNGGGSDQFSPLSRQEFGKNWMITLTTNGGGYELRAGLRLGRTNQFRASEIQYEVSSSDPGNIFAVKGNFPGLSVSRIGIDWTTGTTYSNGDPVVNEVIIFGVSRSFSSPSEVIANFVANNRPWTVTFTYRVNGNLVASRDVQFNLPTPKLQTFWEGGRNPRWFIEGSTLGLYQLQFRTNATLGEWRTFDPGRKISPNFLFPFPTNPPVFLRVFMSEP